MKLANLALAAIGSLAALGAACSDSAANKSTPTAPGSDGGADGGDTFTSSEKLDVAVPATGRVYVKLASPPAVVTPADPKTDKTWDLAFEGLDVFTNGGPSGPGNAAAFGPNDPIVFLGDTAPTPPFLSADTTGGAFIRWWFYGGAAANHALYTRFHVYGIKDGAKQYKVQVLDYYGLRAGAPTSALYRIRWAEVTATGVGPTQDLADLDGTAGGTTADPNVKSECLDLGTSARTMLTPAEARASSAWHLCFRREDISVNGEVGGPRGVGAVDLDAASSPNDTLSGVVQKTPESEQAHFDGVNAASLANQPFRGDRVVSAFGTLWLELGANPVAPSTTAWLVQGADGTSKYLVGFASFTGATATSPGTIAMRVKSVNKRDPMMNRFSLLLVATCALPLCVIASACSSTTTTAAAPDGGSTSGDVPGDGGGSDGPAAEAGPGATSCTSARDQLLVPIDKVATGMVSVVSDSGGVKTLYVDASAGGIQNAIKNPRIYVDLGAGTRVDVTDTTAPMSTAWDLALKRDKIFTNSGDAGAGQGGAASIAKTFSSVDAASANAEPLFTEKFFDADCNPQLDQTMTVSTTFDDWYDYDQVTHIPSPKDVTYVVRGGTGKKYKVAIKSYMGEADGGTGSSTGYYILQVSAL